MSKNNTRVTIPEMGFCPKLKVKLYHRPKSQNLRQNIIKPPKIKSEITSHIHDNID